MYSVGQWRDSRSRCLSGDFCFCSRQRASRFTLVEASQSIYTDTRECSVARLVSFGMLGSACLLRNCLSFTSWVYPLLNASKSQKRTDHRLRATVVGLYTSYGIPILLRITSGRNKFVPGPFSLGWLSVPIGIVAVAWATFVSILLLFPTGQTVTKEDMSA